MSRVYFVQAGGDLGPIKIGSAKNVASRLVTLQTGNHEDLRLLFEIYVGGERLDGSFAAEAAFHCFFHDLHIRGDWFRRSEEIVSLIEKLRRTEVPGDRDVEMFYVERSGRGLHVRSALYESGGLRVFVTEATQ